MSRPREFRHDSECGFNAETQRTQREAQRSKNTLGGRTAFYPFPRALPQKIGNLLPPLISPWFSLRFLCALCVSALKTHSGW